MCTASGAAAYSLWPVTVFCTTMDLLIIDREKAWGVFWGQGFPSTAEDSAGAALEADFQCERNLVSTFPLDLPGAPWLSLDSQWQQECAHLAHESCYAISRSVQNCDISEQRAIPVIVSVLQMRRKAPRFNLFLIQIEDSNSWILRKLCCDIPLLFFLQNHLLCQVILAGQIWFLCHSASPNMKILD